MIKVENKAEYLDISITGDIVDDGSTCWYSESDHFTYPTAVYEQLQKNPNKPLNVRINSLGGDVFAGIGIYNILKSHKAKSTARIEGIAGSSASIIAFGCDEIILPKNGYLMIHKPLVNVFGNALELQSKIELLDKIQSGIVDSYMSKSKVSREKVNDLVNNETWLQGLDARQYFDIIVEDSEVKNCTSSIMNKTELPDFIKSKVVNEEMNEEFMKKQNEENQPDKSDQNEEKVDKYSKENIDKVMREISKALSNLSKTIEDFNSDEKKNEDNNDEKKYEEKKELNEDSTDDNTMSIENKILNALSEEV